MSARSTYEASAATAHGSAQTGGITFSTGATVTPPGNATTWSRYSAESARAFGSITQAQYVSVMNAIGLWEQEQISSAKATLRATGDLGPA